MRWRVLIWLLLSSTAGMMVWCWFSYKGASLRVKAGVLQPEAPAPARPAFVGTNSPAQGDLASLKPRARRPFGYRLSNTSKSLDELIRNPRAILLENAFLDTSVSLDLPLPDNLKSHGDPGSYLVQCQGELNDIFRRTLIGAGAKWVAYIPNNAYLVRLDAAGASRLATDPQVAAVIPYEPYFKIKSSLLDSVLLQDSAPDNQPDPIAVNVLLFDDNRAATLVRLKDAGVDILAEQRAPFGSLAEIRCTRSALAWIAAQPGVQELERARTRVPASDLSRARIGVATNSVTSSSYLGLTGSNVIVNVNDLGVDSNHPDLTGRVLWDIAASGLDTNGHGTHVAGLIAGNGGQSLTVTNSPGSVAPPSPMQFRGLAPAARIFSIAVPAHSSPSSADAYLQQSAVLNQAFISNNSWHYNNDTDYDLGAASYDAAVRDALPGVTGSQPLLCVFAAGNAGLGNDDGTGGLADSIQSPGTAKNVITVGAIEQPRWIANPTWSCSTNSSIVTCQTNTPWLLLTDSSNQVAGFSSRGNVGLGTEGNSGRFKPDVVAPGTFIISTRSTTWDQAAYYSRSNNFLSSAPDANYEQVLSNLNNGLGPFYRFESGTSLAAAEVSGTLALLQEFFEQRLLRTNSPALMKALLINGARSLGSGYDLHSSGPTNYQGWGLVQLPNSLPASLLNTSAPTSSIWIFDQTLAGALSTGQQRTRFVSLTQAARNLPLRVTLAWTDPPGNPVAGLKLVNNLDLIVTNLDTGGVFFGNDIPAGASYNAAWVPGSIPNLDSVNNVENVYLSATLGTNYSVTVLGRRIAVNAVTEQPNGVVQDFALVISCGDGQITNALTLTDAPTVSVGMPIVTPITNSFAADGADFGAVLLHQRIGTSAPLLDTNTIPLPGSSNAVITVGTLNQWHFYVFTNNTAFTNAAFLTFLTRPLSLIPGAGGSLASAEPGQVWPARADLDLYVSTNSALTNLNPLALAAADMSLGRAGPEMVIYSNATPGVYYLGVKCESLLGAEYGLLADTSLLPFAQTDSQGNEFLRGFPAPAVIPGGTASGPGAAYVLYVTPDTFPLRRAIVTNVVTCPSLTDLQGTLTHGSSSVVLNNHSTDGASQAPTFVYDDSGEGDVPGALPSDGPGSLRDFSGKDGGGLWFMTMVSTNRPGTNLNSEVFLELEPDLSGAILATILPGNCREDFVSVPLAGTNLTAMATIAMGTGPILLQVYPANASASNCPSLLISSANGTGSMSIDDTSNPPLNPGSYVIRTCNLGPGSVDTALQANVALAAVAPPPIVYTSTSQVAILDDALSSSVLMVTNTDPILSAEVGVRIIHPRVSDLVVTLISPDGTRVLLDAGRGGASTNGMGANLVVTNTTPVSYSGGPEAVTNTFDTGQTSGTILINYNFFALPDTMHVYYETNLLFDSGLVSFDGATNLQYGPGKSTLFTIVMNEGGNNESNTAWFYSITSTRLEPLYLTFTEDTNLTVTPIKFAPTPFTNFTVAPSGASAESGIFYLPEESLNQLLGRSAYGLWRLEVWDTRTGATNPSPTLLSWQLELRLGRSVPVPIALVHGAPSTNLLGPGQLLWYEIDVPGWASFATNSLLTSTAPVNLLFNSTAPPTGTNAGDFTLALGSSSGRWVLRTNAVPGLTPASDYYLGIQNTNPTTVTISFSIDFDASNVIPLLASVPFANTNNGPLNSADYYSYLVSTNAVRVQFEINGPSSDVTLVARQGPPLPSLGSFDFLSANPGTNDELIVVYEYSRPVSLSAREWYLAVINVTGSPASYSILATEFPDYGTNILVSAPAVDSNAVCVTWSSLPGVHYFLEGKIDIDDSSWTTLSPTLTASDYTTTFCIPLPSEFEYFRVSEGLVLTPALPIISSVALAANGTLLQWSAPTNLQFGVQWTLSLAPAGWRSFPGSVTSSNGTFLFLDNGSQTGGLDGQRFYRLRQLP
jgi:subtilisin-like proprotein convertase family protein